MEKFHCTYEQMMNEPYEIIQTNLMIMSLEAEEENRQQKMQKLKSRVK
jgi:hypothetical protein